MARRVASTIGLRSQHGLIWVIEAEWMLLSGQPGPTNSLYHRDCSRSMIPHCSFAGIGFLQWLCQRLLSLHILAVCRALEGPRTIWKVFKFRRRTNAASDEFRDTVVALHPARLRFPPANFIAVSRCSRYRGQHARLPCADLEV